MQTLWVKTKDAAGNDLKRKILVKRAWTNISGLGVFLHMDGTYGFRDGAPVRSLADIREVIHDKIQLKAAENWWDRIGEKQSAAYYDALEKRRRLLAGDYTEGPVEGDSDLDMILYSKIPAGEAPEDHQVPNTWMELGFKKRPDWWGQASGIQFDDFLYVKYEEIEPGEDALPHEILVGQQQLAEMSSDFLNENDVIVRFVDDELYDEYGPLSVTKTTQKYAEAETAFVDEDAKIYFTGNKEPHAKIPISDLMVVSVTATAEQQGPPGESEDWPGKEKEPETASPF